MNEYRATGAQEHGQTRFTVERVQGGEQAGEYADELLSIYDTVFREIYNPKLFWEGRMALTRDVADPESTFVLLREKTNGIVGFTYAFPTQKLDPGSSNTLWLESRTGGYTVDKFREMQEQTAEVGATAILRESRHQGGWSLMMSALDDAVKEGYTYMARYVTTIDNADRKVWGRYKYKVVYKSRHMGAPLNHPQVYCRVKMK